MSKRSPVRWVRRSGSGAGLIPNGLDVGYIGDPEARRSVVIASLLHGDEDPGLLVVHELLERLDVSWRPTGLIKIIPALNPDAVIARSRTSPLDRLDANRMGLGDAQGQITERLVAAACAEAAGAGLFVALHSFETATSIAGVFTDPPEPAVRSTVLRALAMMRPDYVLTIPFSPLCASLDGALNEIQIPSLSVELPRMDLLSSTDLDVVVRGLLRTLQWQGVAELKPDGEEPRPTPICYRRSTIRSARVGVWQPERELGATLAPGDRLGTLAYLPAFEHEQVVAPRLGDPEARKWFVLQVRPREVVRPNDILFGLGREDPKLTFELSRLASDVANSPAPPVAYHSISEGFQSGPAANEC